MEFWRLGFYKLWCYFCSKQTSIFGVNNYLIFPFPGTKIPPNSCPSSLTHGQNPSLKESTRARLSWSLSLVAQLSYPVVSTHWEVWVMHGVSKEHLNIYFYKAILNSLETQWRCYVIVIQPQQGFKTPSQWTWPANKLLWARYSLECPLNILLSWEDSSYTSHRGNGRNHHTQVLRTILARADLHKKPVFCFPATSNSA